ncbi:MAG: flagellar export protein FliJ [Thermaerobacter sp.]|nr:flagellar export protein FliJ [Thermaerobacter sp.]
MKVFRFRLQRVLEVKRLRVGREQEALADHLRTCQREDRELKRLHQVYSTAREGSRQGRLGTVSPEEQSMWISRLAWVDGQLARQRESLERAQDALEEQRRILARAWRERESLERLRKRRRAEHRIEEGRAEQKELDESRRNRPA